MAAVTSVGTNVADTNDVDATAATADTDFPALFRTYLENGTQQALQQLRTHPDALRHAQTREHVLHMLDFALGAPHVYRQARELVERITPTMEQAGFWESWIPYLNKAVIQSQRQDDPQLTAFCEQWLGQFYQNQSKFPLAHEHLSAATQQFAALHDDAKQAQALNRLAYLARLQRRYAEAEEHVSHALQLLPAADPERSFCYFVQGVIAFDRQEWSLAIELLQASLAISEKYDDTVTIARRLRNLGPALRATGRYAEAIACYERAIALFNTVHDPVQQAVTQMNLGVLYLQRNEPQKAVAQFVQGEPVFRQTHDWLHLAMLYTNQGIAQRMLSAWLRAESSLARAIELWQKLGNLSSQINALDELALTHLAQGEGERALCVLQSAFTLLQQLDADPAYEMRRQKLLQRQAEANAMVDGCHAGYDASNL